MKKQHEDYGLSLQDRYDRWEYVFAHGASDPFWEDGCNLNLIRNHIIYYREKIEETLSQEKYPAAYFNEIPQEVDSKYMARADEIRVAAKVSLAKYKADPNYQYLLQHYDDFTPKTRDKLCLDNVIGYATGLSQCIQNDDLLGMRRHETYERYLKSFEECVHRMQATPSETVQLSLFPFSVDDAAGTDDVDDDDDFYDEFDEIDDEMEM